MAVNRKLSRAQEDYVTNRILVLFTCALLLVLGLMLSYRGYARVDTYTVTNNILFGMMLVGLGVLLVCAVLTVLRARGGNSAEYKILTPFHGMLAAAGLTICAFFGWRFGAEGIMFMCAFIPGLAALLLVYLLYPFEFFGIASVSASASVLCWYIARATGDGFVWTRGIKMGKPLYFVIIAIILLTAYALFNLKLRKGKGVLDIGGKTRTLYAKTAKYRLTFITAALAFVCVLAGYLLGSTIAYYAMFAVLAWMFALVVYYTVKMM